MTLFKCTGFGDRHEIRDGKIIANLFYCCKNLGYIVDSGLKRKVNIRNALKEKLIGGRKEELPPNLENLSFIDWGKRESTNRNRVVK